MLTWFIPWRQKSSERLSNAQSGLTFGDVDQTALDTVADEPHDSYDKTGSQIEDADENEMTLSQAEQARDVKSVERFVSRRDSDLEQTRARLAVVESVSMDVGTQTNLTSEGIGDPRRCICFDGPSIRRTTGSEVAWCLHTAKGSGPGYCSFQYPDVACVLVHYWALCGQTASIW